MSTPATLILGGSLVYLSNGDAGALMIAAGCSLELVRWLNRVLPKWEKRTKHESTNEA